MISFDIAQFYALSESKQKTFLTRLFSARGTPIGTKVSWEPYEVFLKWFAVASAAPAGVWLYPVRLNGVYLTTPGGNPAQIGHERYDRQTCMSTFYLGQLSLVVSQYTSGSYPGLLLNHLNTVELDSNGNFFELGFWRSYGLQKEVNDHVTKTTLFNLLAPQREGGEMDMHMHFIGLRISIR